VFVSSRTDYRAAYPFSIDLKSEERKSSYRVLLKYSQEWLLNGPVNKIRGLKILHFEGLVSEKKESELGIWEPLLICLSAPSLDKQFILRVFGEFRAVCAEETILKYLDGEQPEEYIELLARFRLVVSALLEPDAPWIHESQENRYYLYVYFVKHLFYMLSNGKSSASRLGAELLVSFEANFDSIARESLASTRSEYLNNTLQLIFSNSAKNPESVYTDPFLVSFFSRYFARQLAPGFQQFCDEIYKSINKYERIGFADGKIIYRLPNKRGFKGLGS
jgi:hypothetical protein